MRCGRFINNNTCKISDLTALEEEGDEVDVSLVRRVEDDAVLLGRLEVDGEVGAPLDLQSPVELEVGVPPHSFKEVSYQKQFYTRIQLPKQHLYC